MKVIFLDIDGVLNCDRTHADAISEIDNREFPGASVSEKIADILYSRIIYADRVEKLAQIIVRTGAKVVITSTWRLTHSAAWFSRVFFDKIGKYIDVIGKTPKLYNANRDHEIARWITLYENEYNGRKLESFVILDDDSVEMGNLMDYLVHVDGLKGLTDDDVNKAVEILGGID